MKPGLWVVCLNSLREPSTWARIMSITQGTAWVRYGKQAPIWTGNAWAIEFLVPKATEAEARKVVEDHDAKINHRP